MTLHVWRWFGATLATLALVPATALADGHAARRPVRSVVTTGGGAPIIRVVDRPTPNDSLTDASPREVRHAHAPGPLVPVNVRIDRDLGNGCIYVATLRGQYRTRGRTRGQGYDPQLTLNARVKCGDRVHAVAPTAHIHGRDLTGRQLVDALAMRGRVLSTSGPQQCTYTPSFSVSGDEIAPHAVWQACSVAPVIGGGPRPRR